MPTFTAIALDRLLEPGASKSMAAAKKASDYELGRQSSTPNSKQDRGISGPMSKLDRRISSPIPKVERNIGASTARTMNMKHHWAQPALYTTPVPTPLPDSSSSFPPSPYVINHKRRGPRLLKNFSEDDVASRQKALDEKEPSDNAKEAEKVVLSSAKNDCSLSRNADDSSNNDNVTFTFPNPLKDENVNGIHDEVNGSSESRISLPVQSLRTVTFNLERDGDFDDFYDPQDSMSAKSTSESENNNLFERSFSLSTPSAEFYDAWEDLSSESGPHTSPRDVEAELREIRLSLLTEIEKRKQAEEALINMRSQWLQIQEQLSIVGLTLPADPFSIAEDAHQEAEDLCRQVHIARLVSNAIGRGTAKAKVETEMEVQVEAKNFEIARLWDRLHYYEAVNREMSQRNQEAVETARRLRHLRKRRQRWVWGSIAAAISLGTAVLSWSFLATGKGSSSHTSEGDQSSK